MKKFGFTLAEVLITLGIIGVVAAVTMPTLISNTKYKQVGTRLAKFHNNLENAARSYVAANGDFSEKDYDKRKSSLNDFFNNSFAYKSTYNHGVQTKDNYIDIGPAIANTKNTNFYKNLCIDYIPGYNSCGILNDDSSIGYYPVTLTWSIDSTKYPAEKYGKAIAPVYFSPNVRGLPENAKKMYVFMMTSKGIVVPADKDSCLSNAFKENYVMKSSWYKSGGACYKDESSSSQPQQQDPES